MSKKEFKVVQMWASGRTEIIATVKYAQEAVMLMHSTRHIKWEDGSHSIKVWSINDQHMLTGLTAECIDEVVDIMYDRINAVKIKDVLGYIKHGQIDEATGERWLHNLGA